MFIDLNCDLGEGYGQWSTTTDADIIPLISSANIACGFHAGDPRTMDRAVQLCVHNQVAIGAHVSYPDIVGFGRRPMQLTPHEITTDILYQLGALEAFCRAHGTTITHLKPHGALYNTAAVCANTAGAIVAAVTTYNPDLIVFTLPGSTLHRQAEQAGITVAPEGFADRSYEPSGSLTPRHLQQALITDHSETARRAVAMAAYSTIETTAGTTIDVDIATICVHGDNPSALQSVIAIREALIKANITITSPEKTS